MSRSLAVALLVMCSANVLAFESNEHKRIGDLSYHIALKTFCVHQPDRPFCDARTKLPLSPGLFMDPLVEAPKPKDTPSYGDLVMCVDYFLSAEKLIAGRETGLVRDFGVKSDSLYPRSADELGLKVRERCSSSLDNWEGARAGHVNHNHFQQEMLLAQRNNHGLSLYLAASGQTLFSALAVNAISDHYLHDTFSPGHITTWRNKLSDVVANSYHDYRNRFGLQASVDLKVLHANALLTDATVKTDVLQLAFEILATKQAAKLFFCDGEGREARFACPAFDSAEVTSRLAALRTKALPNTALSTELTEFKGDQLLYRATQDFQRFVMLMTAVRSIHDILETDNPHGKVVLKDSFSASSWAWNYEEKDNADRATLLSSSEIVASMGPVSYHVKRGYMVKDGQNEQNRIDNRNVDNIFGVSLGIDNMTFGSTQSRYYVGLEQVISGFTLFDGLRGKLSRQNDIGNIAWTVGIQPFVNSGPNGVALTTRLLMIHPETETAFSVQAKALRLAPAGKSSTWRPYLGLRMDMGLTSFMTMYLQAGKDAAVQRDGTIRSGPSVGGGVQLGAPTCRFPGLQNIFC